MTDKILITGAAGFIGSHLVERLLQTGRSVRAFVHYNSMDRRGWLDSLPQSMRHALDVVPGDIRDSVCVREAVRECGEILHLAALIGIPYSYRAPDNYLETNIRGTLNVVQAARDFGLRKVVVTSTSEVYGTAQSVPISEQHPLVGQSPYSASKIGADQIALSYYRSFGTPVAVVRPFNTFGPRQSMRAVVPTVITQLLVGSGPVRLGALEPRRDLTYVSDTVEGIIAVLGSAQSTGEVINLGTGFDISVGELANLIASVMGVKAEIEHDAARMRPKDSEVDLLRADNSKARKLLNWQPQLAGLDGLRRGLERTVAWFRDPANRAHYQRIRYTV